jgi:L-methionine (R)-S-oxide reductase
MKKEEKYIDVFQRLTALLEGEDDLISKMSTVSCEVYQEFEYFLWVGFYRRVNENLLKVGPYQGTHGCLKIPLGKGVCGKCAEENSVQVENDVTKIPHHIACSSETKSEIVLPITDESNRVIAVFDIDSVEVDSFDETDEKYLKIISKMI